MRFSIILSYKITRIIKVILIVTITFRKKAIRFVWFQIFPRRLCKVWWSLLHMCIIWIENLKCNHFYCFNLLYLSRRPSLIGLFFILKTLLYTKLIPEIIVTWTYEIHTSSYRHVYIYLSILISVTLYNKQLYKLILLV